MTRIDFVPPDEAMRKLIASTKTIAVVGISDDPSRPSNDVASYLHDRGFQIVPINPNLEQIWGLTAYPSLTAAREAGQSIDMVDVFRKPEAVGPIADEAVRIGAKSLWLQEGVINQEAAERAARAGLAVVMDRCVKKEHRRLIRR